MKPIFAASHRCGDARGAAANAQDSAQGRQAAAAATIS